MPDAPGGLLLHSTRVSDASAAVLALFGLALLFGSAELLPQLAPSLTPQSAWLGELVASGLLALAILNWATRTTLLGGVYGRPIVLANALFWFTSTMTMSRLVSRGVIGGAGVVVLVPLVTFTALYGWMLFRGPLGDDYERFRAGA